MPAVKETKVHFKPQEAPFDQPSSCLTAVPEEIAQYTADADRVTCQTCIIRIVDAAMRHVNGLDKALT